MYRCSAEAPSVLWQVNNHEVTLSYTDTAPEVIDGFKFEVRNDDDAMIVTTATLVQARFNDTGTKIECSGEGTMLTELVEVAS